MPQSKSLSRQITRLDDENFFLQLDYAAAPPRHSRFWNCWLATAVICARPPQPRWPSAILDSSIEGRHVATIKAARPRTAGEGQADRTEPQVRHERSLSVVRVQCGTRTRLASSMKLLALYRFTPRLSFHTSSMPLKETPTQLANSWHSRSSSLSSCAAKVVDAGAEFGSSLHACS